MLEAVDSQWSGFTALLILVNSGLSPSLAGRQLDQPGSGGDREHSAMMSSGKLSVYEGNSGKT